MRSTVKSCLSSGMALSIALLAQSVSAQTAPADVPEQTANGSSLEDIVVTARKVGEASQSLPISVAAFNGEQLTQRVVLAAQDLQAISPGLTVSNNPTGGVPIFAIRGTATELGIDGGVALYFNDVPLISTIGIMNAFYDISTVEILKGPQGTQFGTNTTGGTISVRSNLPTARFEGYVKAGLGNFDRREFEGMINLPVNDVVGFRFAGNYVKRDGYVKNRSATAGFPSSYQDENHYSLRGTMAIDTGPLQNVLIADYYNRDEAPFAAVPVQFERSALGIFLPDLGAQLGNYNTIYQGANSTGVQPQFFGKADLYGLQNKTDLELSDTISLRNVLGYRNDHTTTSEDTAGLSVVTVGVQRDDKASQWTNDFTVRYDNTDIGLRASLGVYYSFLRRETGINANVLQGIFAPFAAFFPGAQNNVISTNNFEIKELKSKAVYFNTEYDVTETLGLTGGFRYNWDDVNSQVTAGGNLQNPATPLGTPPIFGADYKPFAAKPCAPSNMVGYPTFNPQTCSATREAKFKAPSWMVGVTNKFSDKVLGYAKISHGYLAGGTNFTLRDAGRTTFQPEKTTMMEIGLKADWLIGDRPIRTNLALYRGKTSNKQVFANSNYNTPPGSTGFGVVNAAKQTVYGADFEMRYSPAEGLTLDFNYNYIRAKFDQFVYPGLGGDGTGLPSGLPGDTFIPSVDLSGATPSQTPKHQINGAVTYVWPFDDTTGKVSTTVSGYYTSSIIQSNRLGAFDAAVGGNLNRLPGYFLANASLNWENVMSSPVSVQFWARNLFNRHYRTASNIQFQTFGYATATFGAPRTFGASASVKF